MAAPDSEWEEIPVADGGGEWEAVPDAAPAEEPTTGVGRARMLGGLQGATGRFSDEMGAGLQAGLAAVTPGMSAGDTYHEALRDNRAEEAKAKKDQPWDYGAASVAGTVASPLNRVLGPLGLVKGGAVLGGLSALGATEATDIPTQALETLKGAGGGMASGGLAGKFPALFPAVAGLGMGTAGVLLDDPELAIGGGLSMLTGGAGLGLRGAGGALAKPGQVARKDILGRLTKEALPGATAAVDAENKASTNTLRAQFAEAQRAKSPLSASPVRKAQAEAAAAMDSRNDDAAARFKEHVKALQSETSPVPDYSGEASDRVAAENSAKLKGLQASDKTAAKDTVAYSKLLKGATSPVRGGSNAVPPAQDLEASARGLQGNEIKENFAFLRSKDPLGLKLGPEAEAGVQSILPDYEATANQSLGQYAQGKDARLKEILANLEAETAAAGKSPAPAGPSHLGSEQFGKYFPNPELMPSLQSVNRPNHLAGFEPKAPSFVPKAAPKVRTPTEILGSDPLGPNRVPLSARLDTSPLRGFVPPESPPQQPAPLPPNLSFPRSFQGIKANPLAGFTPKPLPTAESLAPSLAGNVGAELARLRGEQGIGSRLLTGAVKSTAHPLVAGGMGGAMYFHRPELAAAAGVLGAGKALVTDPVLATEVLEPVGRLLQGGGPVAERVGRFLQGAEGPMLTKKIEFLMQNDPEFAQAVENGQQP